MLFCLFDVVSFVSLCVCVLFEQANLPLCNREKGFVQKRVVEREKSIGAVSQRHRSVSKVCKAKELSHPRVACCFRGRG